VIVVECKLRVTVVLDAILYRLFPHWQVAMRDIFYLDQCSCARFFSLTIPFSALPSSTFPQPLHIA
jgi:hypothetical protein